MDASLYTGVPIYACVPIYGCVPVYAFVFSGQVLILGGTNDLVLTQALDAFDRSGVTTMLVNPAGASVASMVRHTLLSILSI